MLTRIFLISNRRVRRELKRTGTSWRVDETYVRVAGRWVYLFRAVDSGGATLDFYLSENRDAAAAKRFFDKVLAAPNHPRARVINVDGKPPELSTLLISALDRMSGRCQ